MTYRDILLPLFTCPDGLSEETMRAAALIAARLGAAGEGEVTALALQVRIRPARNRLANFLVRIDDLVRDENARNAQRALEAETAWKAIAQERGLNSRGVVLSADLYGEGDALAAAARTHDVCLVPVGPRIEIDHYVAESVLFGSGRPILVFPESADVGEAATFERIAVAWDGSRAAARALADAMPLLRAARQIRLLTVIGEKESATSGLGAPVLRHLKRHGVEAAVEEIEAGARPIGQVLAAYVSAHADLLVMGGFGHSRAREFLLGGATAAVLREPQFPVFLSH